MKLFHKERTKDKTFDGYSLHDAITHARLEVEDAYNNFQNASDPDLIDCYIYTANAASKRYSFLLKQAKML